jgi:hypothetical protein
MNIIRIGLRFNRLELVCVIVFKKMVGLDGNSCVGKCFIFLS